MKKIIIYDFDGTLTKYPVPKFEIINKCLNGLSATGSDIVEIAMKRAKEKNIDFYEAIYDLYMETIKNAGFKLNDENFSLGYDLVEYNSGVKEFLEMTKKKDMYNYIVSSGIKVLIEKTEVSKYFNDIYATTFKYDENNEAVAMDYILSDKNKVDAIKDIISKNGLKEENFKDIIYVGDGLTDYYAMEYVKSIGGTAIYVYFDENNNEMLKMKQNGIVDYFFEADFSKESKLYKYIEKLCNN